MQLLTYLLMLVRVILWVGFECQWVKENKHTANSDISTVRSICQRFRISMVLTSSNSRNREKR